MADVENNFTTILLERKARCDHPEYSGQTMAKAWTLLVIKLAGLLPYFCIFPATLRLAKQRTAFHILFQTNSMHCILLIRELIIYSEYLIGARIHYPLDIDAFLAQLVLSALNWAYILLALNRLVAIFAKLKYDQICTEMRIKIAMAICWMLGLGFSVYFNHRSELRIYDCMAALMPEFPPFGVQKYDQGAKLMANIANFGLMLVSFLPSVIYLICLIKMVYDWIKRNSHLTNNNDPVPGVVHAPAPASDAIARAAREHSRLFLICFLSTLPHLISSSILLALGLIVPNARPEWAGTVYTRFDDMFHLQQPISMILLSTDLRKDVCNDMRKFLAKLGIYKNSITPSVNVITAWTTK